MKTTLEMPDGLFRRAKSTAAQRGQSLKQLVTTALEKELAEPSPRTGAPRRRRAEADKFFKELKAISKRISASWPEGVDAVEAVREQRRY